jgi:hypothetical protein
MSDNTNFGFAKLVPGFDFLQNLAKGASHSLPQLPNLSSWIAPTLNVEELEKRISELKAVHFWLDQNSKALGATIQALEVQKMTLATLQGMNFSMGEVANALKLKPEPATPTAMHKAAAPEPALAATAARRKAEPEKPAKAKGKAGNGSAAPVDPLQWWGALTQQFQEIAANAMKDVAQKATVGAAKTAVAKAATKTAKKPAPRKTAARKTATSS